jgi:hypothetical protein
MYYSWIDHGKLHQTWQTNQAPGLDSNPEYPEYEIHFLTTKPVSSVGLVRTLEPGCFPLHMHSPLKLIIKPSIFRRVNLGVLDPLSCDGDLPQSTILVPLQYVKGEFSRRGRFLKIIWLRQSGTDVVVEMWMGDF